MVRAVKRHPGHHVQSKSDERQVAKRQQAELRRRALADKPAIDRKRGKGA